MACRHICSTTRLTACQAPPVDETDSVQLHALSGYLWHSYAGSAHTLAADVGAEAARAEGSWRPDLLPGRGGGADRCSAGAGAGALGHAFYAGLRPGELRALRWEDIDLTEGVIRVERSWDPTAGVVEPKSRSGRREVPLVAQLRTVLLAHALSTGRRNGLALGRSATEPFGDTTMRNRAEKAWRDAGLTPSGLHEARHAFASILLAAGVGFKAVSTYMGHSSITITLDRYGHLMPGQGAETVERVDAYLAAATAEAIPRASTDVTLGLARFRRSLPSWAPCDIRRGSLRLSRPRAK